MARLDITTAVKYYPPHKDATTGAGKEGAVRLEQCDDVLREMTNCRIPLLGHFEEVEDKNGRIIKPAEREGYMVDNFLWGFRDKYPDLLKSFEHGSTAKGVEWLKADNSGKSFMTATPQHSLFAGPAIEEFGVELECMPCLKTAEDLEAVVGLITSGDERCGSGNDEAPHAHGDKEAGAKGCWTPDAAEMMAEVFDNAGALDQRFENFMSLNAPRWWNLALPEEHDTVTFRRQDAPVSEPVDVPELHDRVISLGWSEAGDLYRLKFKAA